MNTTGSDEQAEELQKKETKTARVRKRLGAVGGIIGISKCVRLHPNCAKPPHPPPNSKTPDHLTRTPPSRPMSDFGYCSATVPMMSRPMVLGILSFLFAASPQNRLFLLLQSSNIIN